MVRSAMGDQAGSLAAIKSSLAAMPTYAPAILSQGSVEYQLRRRAKGRRLFLSLLELPKKTADLAEIIDEAGSFLIHQGEYQDGLELFRLGAARFPDQVELHRGVGCCAGHLGLHEEALAASQKAIELAPKSQEAVNDLGWTLLEAGRLEEAREMLERAVAMNPKDALAAENLRYCKGLARRRTRARKPRGAT
jgi:Flp pilus assembly protein TadD